jgi:hypothetical protein
MGKRILGIVAALVIVYALYYAYQRHIASQATEGAIRDEETGAALVKESDPAPADTSTQSTPVNGSNIVQPTTSVTPSLSGTIAAAVPATDSIAPNPTNGTAYAGTGKFQVYRQGNLTWRVDTESGLTCVLFATMEEWKKAVVYRHACNS